MSKICKECKQKYYVGEGWYHKHGRNNPRYDAILSTQTKQKLSIAATGRIITEETKRKISDTMKKKWESGEFDHKILRSTKLGYRKDLGHLVRSTWEANFARILNYLGIEYKYEPICFDLDITNYTPDFYLPDKDMYIEIKGRDTKEVKNKRIMVRQRYGIKIKVIKWKRYNYFQNKYSKLILNWE